MADKIRAAEELKKLGRQFKNLLELVDELERVGSLENAAKDVAANHALASQNVAKAEKEEQVIRDRIKVLKEQSAIVVQNAENKRLSAEEAARDIVDRATIEAGNITKSAQNALRESVKARELVMDEINVLDRTRTALLSEIETLNKRKEAALAEARKIFEG